MKGIEIILLSLKITFVLRISIFRCHIGRDSNNELMLIIKFDEAVAPCHRNLHILLKTSTSEIKMKMRHVKEKKKITDRTLTRQWLFWAIRKTVLSWKFRVDTLHFLYFSPFLSRRRNLFF